MDCDLQTNVIPKLHNVIIGLFSNYWMLIVALVVSLSNEQPSTSIWFDQISYYFSHVMRKPVLGIWKQQRCRSVWASAQSDQHFVVPYLGSIIPILAKSKKGSSWLLYLSRQVWVLPRFLMTWLILLLWTRGNFVDISIILNFKIFFLWVQKEVH